MSRRFVLSGVAAVLAAAAMVGGPIAAANATDLTIKLALVHAAPGLSRSDLRLRSAFARYQTGLVQLSHDIEARNKHRDQPFETFNPIFLKTSVST